MTDFAVQFDYGFILVVLICFGTLHRFLIFRAFLVESRSVSFIVVSGIIASIGSLSVRQPLR